MNHTSPASLFNRNPELIRNLWLEISPIRLIAIPVIIALIMLILYVNSRGNDITAQANPLLCFLFILGTLCWGTYQINASLTQEFSQGTWDTQRLSSLTPLQMVIGKLFGASCVAWYGGAILFVVYLTTNLLQATRNGIPVTEALGHTVFVSINLALLALCSHTLLLLITLYGARNNRHIRFGTILILLIFVFIPLFNIPARNSWSNLPIGWFSHAIPLQLFLLQTLFLLFVSLFIGLLRLMRLEFNHKLLPFYLFAQTLFWIVYCAGLTFPMDETEVKNSFFIFTTSLSRYLMTWLVTLAIVAIAAALSARNDRLWWKKLFLALKQRRNRDALTQSPVWLSLLGVWLIVALAALIYPHYSTSGYLSSSLTAYLLGLLGFMLRDIFFILWINLQPVRKNPFTLAVAALIVAHVLLPILFGAIINNGQYLWLLPTAIPEKPLESVLFVFSALIQCLIFAGLLAVKIRPLWQNREPVLHNLPTGQDNTDLSISKP